MKCVICGKQIDEQVFPDGVVWTRGHNAEPVKKGRCCTSCNNTVVIPFRLGYHYQKEKR